MKTTNSIVTLFAGIVWLAAGAATFGADTGKPAADQGTWTPLPDSALPDKNTDGAKLPVISKGAIHGLGVDPTSGDIYVLLPNQGIWKSTDQGQTFKECGDIKARGMEYSASMNMNPAGKGAAAFAIYGQSGITSDDGKTWTALKTDLAPKSFDFGAVAWEAGGKAILAYPHEHKLHLVLSIDGGVTWKDLGDGFWPPVGIFDEKTLCGFKGGHLLRSTDAGATWIKAADLSGKRKNQVINVYKGVGYLMTDNGLLVSKDKGATWSIQGSAVKTDIGPFFADENYLAAVGPEGCYETSDTGKTWTQVAPLAPDAGTRDFAYAWDPVHNIFYFAESNHPAMKCVIASASAPAKNK